MGIKAHRHGKVNESEDGKAKREIYGENTTKEDFETGVIHIEKKNRKAESRHGWFFRSESCGKML